MTRYPEVAWERAMKLQDVMLRAMAKAITWWRSPKIIGISDRGLRRGQWCYKQSGCDELFNRRRGGSISKRVPVETVEDHNLLGR